MNQLIVRRADTEFSAFLTAQAMQSNYDVEVISIVQWKTEDGYSWNIYAKFNEETTKVEDIDTEIDIAIRRAYS